MTAQPPARRARTLAARWVRTHARLHPAYRGAYLTGSVLALPDDAVLAPASDVDVTVVTAHGEPPPRAGKFTHEGVLLDVSSLPEASFASAEEVLGDYHLASALRAGMLLDDPTGRLRPLHHAVDRDFADARHVRRRCEDAAARAARFAAAVDPAGPFAEQVTRWLFACGVTAHVLLVAGLRPPTVRRRYAAVRGLLLATGHVAEYDGLLDLLGCRRLSRDDVRRHLDVLARTVDATAAVARTPFFFTGDLTPAGRRVTVGGCEELFAEGLHREAVFWTVAVLARCHTQLAADDPALARTLEPGFRAVLADLGVTSAEDLERRAADVAAFLPHLRQTAERVRVTSRG